MSSAVTLWYDITYVWMRRWRQKMTLLWLFSEVLHSLKIAHLLSAAWRPFPAVCVSTRAPTHQLKEEIYFMEQALSSACLTSEKESGNDQLVSLPSRRRTNTSLSRMLIPWLRYSRDGEHTFTFHGGSWLLTSAPGSVQFIYACFGLFKG